jgi:hypothetical protein
MMFSCTGRNTRERRALPQAAQAVLLAAAFSAGGASAQTLLVNAPVFPLTQVGQSVTQNVSFQINTGGNSVVFNSIALASGFGDFTLGAITGCVVDGSTVNTDGAVCVVPVTFSPLLPGNASAQEPIARSAPLLVSDVENGTAKTYSFGLVGSGTQTQPVLIPGIITDIVGNDLIPIVGYSGDGGPANQAEFNGPTNLAVDVAGNMYISDTGNCVVRRVDAVTHTIALFAGVAPSPMPNCGAGTDGVAATASLLNHSNGIAVDAAGNVYIADTGNHAIRLVSAATGLIQTVAGTLGTPGFSGDGAAATAALLTGPMGVTVDGFGDIFLADTGNFVVREVTVTNGVIQTIAGVGGQQGAVAATAGANQPATSFNFNSPQAVAVDSAGNVYVADPGGGSLWQVAVGTGTITNIPTVTGAPLASVSVDASDALYYVPLGTADCSAYKTVPQSGLGGPVAGTGQCLGSGDGGEATLATLNFPKAIVPDGAGNLYILETDGVRFVNSSPSVTANVAFDSQNVGTTSAPVEFTLFDVDVPTLNGASPNAMQAYFQQPLNPPFFTVPPPGTPDCSQGFFYLYPGGFCNLQVVFAPTAEGTFSGSTGLRSTMNGQPVVTSFNLTGTGQGPLPTATLLPGGPLNFAAVVKGAASAAQTVVLKNTSANTNLTISGIGFANAGNVNYVPGFFQTNNCGMTLAPGATCNILVSFQTNFNGTFDQQLIVTDDTTAGQQMVSLVGTAQIPVAALSPMNLGFGSTQYYGSVSAGQAVTLTNNGDAPLNIASITLGGQFPAEFSVSPVSCPNVLPAGQACNIEVFFQPDAPGAYTAYLQVNDDSGGQAAGTTVQQSAYLSGTSPTPVENSSFAIANNTFAATSVGASLIQTVTLTLQSPETVLQSIVVGPGNTQYSVGAITGCVVDGATMNAAGVVCQIPVTFTPTLVGYSLSGSLLVTTVENGLPVPYTFALTGTSNGTVAALTPGILYPYLAGYNTGSGGGVCQAGTGCTATGFGQSATTAAVGYLNGQTIDSYGNLYVSDSYYDVIYKIDTTGLLSIYAGRPFTTGTVSQVLYGDGLPAVNANVAQGGPMTMDYLNNLFLSDTDYEGHAAIRRIDAHTHIITTVVGLSTQWNPQTVFPAGSQVVITINSVQYIFTTAIGGTSGSVVPNWPTAMSAKVQDGSVSWKNQGVYSSTNSGCTTATDTLYDGCLGTQVPAAGGQLATDNLGNLYFSDGSAIQEWTAKTGLVSLVAGGPSGAAGTNPDFGGQAVGATISASALAINQGTGDIYFIDNGLKVRKVTPTGTISTVAGINKTLLPITSPTSPQCRTGLGPDYPSGDGGPATAAGFGGLTGIALDQANDIYLVDGASCQVRRIDAGTQTITTVAGLDSFGTGEWGNLGDPYLQADGSAVLAGLAAPNTINLDARANMYIMGVLDVRKVNVSQSVIDFSRVFAGGVVEPVGESTGPMTATVLNAGNAGALTFNSPFTDPTAYGISTGDFARDVSTIDCITTGSLNPGTECNVNIDFTPTVVGTPITDTEIIGDNAGTQQQTITLLGSSISAAAITLTPSLLSFVAAPGTTAVAQNFTLTNGTAVAIPVTGVSLIGANVADFAETNNCPFTLSAGQSCTIVVTFTPPALGQYVAQVSTTETFAGSPVTQLGGLTGLGANALAQFLNFRGFLDFGDQNIDVPSTPHVFTLDSYGSQPLLISSITIAGTNANQFAVSGTTCGASLAPSQTCTISVTFTPLSDSPGNPPVPFAATLNVADNAPDTPQQLPLSGIGVGVAPTPFNVTEAIHLSETPLPPPASTNPVMPVNETIHVLDSLPAVAESVVMPVNELIHVLDSLPSLSESALMPVNEFIHVLDSLPSLSESALMPVNETIHVIDTPGTKINATLTSLVPSATAVVIGGSVTLTATVAQIGASAIPSGSVSFYQDGTLLGAVTLTSGSAMYATAGLATGSHSFYAVYGGSSGFLESTSTSITVTATSLNILTVSAQAASRKYGAANPAFVPTYTGWVNGDGPAVLTGSPALSTTAGYLSAPGQYAINVSVAGITSYPSNYYLSASPGTLTVMNGAMQTIAFTLPNVPISLSVGPLTLTGMSTSGLPVSYTVTSGPATVAGSTLTLTGTGTVTVTATQPGNADYAAATPVAATITVTP